MSKIVLGITGGISAYKSIFLLRELIAMKAEVKVVLTQSAREFVTPLTIQALTNDSVRTALFDPEAERAMSHIELARWADYLVIAPASANFMAKMAHGMADCLLSTVYLATENIPTIICPAMNQAMWQHPATQDNCATLLKHGVMLVGPDVGAQACGEFGPGRLVENQEIINAILLCHLKNSLKGQKVVITAGPTQEMLDPVRYLTNHSSGKMGYALAAALQIAGADVTLISGPTNLPKPLNVNLINVKSATDMLSSVLKNITKDSIFISSAAVADYRVASPASQKIKKGIDDTLELKLIKNPDILKEVAHKKLAKYTIGFAAETNDLIANARKKLQDKKVDMLIANEVGENIGFNSDENAVTIFFRNKTVCLEKENKISLAGKIIDILAKEVI